MAITKIWDIINTFTQLTLQNEVPEYLAIV